MIEIDETFRVYLLIIGLGTLTGIFFAILYFWLKKGEKPKKR